LEIETLKVRTKYGRKIGIQILIQKIGLFIEIGLGKTTYLIGFLK
jgi:hypothetical protein